MINVFISPNYKGVPANVDNGGIRRVVEAENKYLEQFGVKSVAHIEEADVIQNQGGMQTFLKGIPIVNTSHGLYWSRQKWGEGMQDVNKTLVEAMVMAVAHTAPSEWVARAIRRGGYFYPEVIYHGVDADEFMPSKNPGKYVLWNKARADLVSDPKDMQIVAERLPKVEFQTTIGTPTDNVKILGVKSYGEMKKIIANAGVYLATARETFGIGTLEAMAAGVPIAGWYWGGQAEIIEQGVTGYLAHPFDFDELANCITRCLAERNQLSINCMEDARLRWKWEPRIKQYADLFKSVVAEYSAPRPPVSVIITAYNLDQYLPKCLESVKTQTMTDFECLVIDDAQSEATEKLVQDLVGQDPRFHYLPTPENLGLPGARNFGFAKSKGKYIRHLDADDWLGETALSLEAEALDNEPGIHIAYGHLAMANADGTVEMVQGAPARAGWPPKQFSWIEQMAHLNQIPSCSMMRREVLQKSAGYRVRCKRQEDAEFWCRVTSLGFRAKKVTEAITYFHRQREDSKGALEWVGGKAEPDWTIWFPWSLGARDYRMGVNALKKCGGIHPEPNIVPFGAQGETRPGQFWPIHDYAYPVVTIIVTVGPGHKEYLIDALDSVQAQTYPDWECFVVNDTGEKWPKYIPGAPWAKVINMDGNQGTSAARNKGLEYSRARLIVWLDADDIWFPWFLERMVAYAEKNDGIIYSDLIMDDGKIRKVYTYNDVNFEEVPFHMSYPGSSIVVPHKIADKIKDLQGGFDTQIPGMEDWDYQIAVHSLGICAHHIPEPLFLYRMATSTKREKDYAKIDSIRDYLDKKWPQYRVKGEKIMCGCNTKRIASRPVSRGSSSGNNSNESSPIPEGADQTQMVSVEYIGPLKETFSIRSKIDRSVNYRFGNNDQHRDRTVFLGDAYYLIQMLDSNSKPMYRMKGSVAPIEGRNPEVMLGAIAA